MGAFGPIRINQPVEIELNYTSGINTFKSRVEGISDDNIVIAAPMLNGQVIPVKNGINMRVSYLDNIALYTFDSIVLSSNLRPVPTLTLDKPGSLKRVQRRNFVRIDARLPMVFTLLKENLESGSEDYDATTIDVSGGGLMFSTDCSLHLHDILEVKLALTDNVYVTALGKVVRIVEKKQQDKHTFSVGLEFSIIEEGERDKIIRYIFNQQRELRRKGLL